jgi:hypothetical protein
MFDHIPAKPRKGRGAVTNKTGRYEREQRYALDRSDTTEADFI